MNMNNFDVFLKDQFYLVALFSLIANKLNKYKMEERTETLVKWVKLGLYYLY